MYLQTERETEMTVAGFWISNTWQGNAAIINFNDPESSH